MCTVCYIVVPFLFFFFKYNKSARRLVSLFEILHSLLDISTSDVKLAKVKEI